MRVIKKGKGNKKCLAYTSLRRPIFKYGASCWDPYREVQIKASDRVQKKAAEFANHTNDLDWETLAQSRKIACICALFIAYTREWALKSTRDRLRGLCYLSRDDRDCKIRVRKQRPDIGKYSFVNRSIKLWNQLPAEAVVTFP